MSTIRILLLCAYDAQSHRHWRDCLMQSLPEFDWTSLVLPGRHFNWRARSNALTFAQQHSAVLNDHYALILATSMVDCAGLRGLVPALSKVPLLVYFHENQFAYPMREESVNTASVRFGSIMNAVVADKVLFNSVYNKDTFFAGAKRFIRQMPDGIHSNTLKHAQQQAQIIPVPVRASLIPTRANRKPDKRPVEIVWNHRWEYDKQPEVFFDALEKLSRKGLDFKVHVIGQRFRQAPECFDRYRQSLARHILTWGYQDEDRYWTILSEADIVVSTALHDFQGLSMLEAIATGCLPVAPDRVAYREYVPDPLRYPCDAGESASLATVLERLLDRRALAEYESVDVRAWFDTSLTDRYRRILVGVSDQLHMKRQR